MIGPTKIYKFVVFFDFVNAMQVTIEIFTAYNCNFADD